ncbi:hypothetical protein SDRG_06956 [Saprolegnia diclina VS20]|uniref:Uncharacterized protein n=1 Tax=Saprolegnia diclina (strain VS20) TaxID=1156394 RepID=T0QCP7_SAPDV|nr:hypothetical protein SDRG_06956 [Saprolegnia diclina VS20]EQC35674.1 hypothetical protein SDRG_06956 [Saprolegnia diclina VS20]|eukprot:XP_008610991.1 hypothetical protein SDRG_06956 [Saprolegnia diclina VS20]
MTNIPSIVSVCELCATTGQCRGPGLSATKYCGVFFETATMSPQSCCCAVALACPKATDALCTCTEIPSDGHSIDWLSSIVLPAAGAALFLVLAPRGAYCESLEDHERVWQEIEAERLRLARMPDARVQPLLVENKEFGVVESELALDVSEPTVKPICYFIDDVTTLRSDGTASWHAPFVYT